jgi:hypothetical protein
MASNENTNLDSEIDLLKLILKKFSAKYPILRNIEIEVLAKNLKIKHCGYCDLIPYGEYFFKGKNRYKMVLPKKIKVWHNSNRETLVFTFLHEISHALTNYCERKTKYGLWIVNDHNRDFYENFFVIANLAYEYKLTKTKYESVEILKKMNVKY